MTLFPYTTLFRSTGFAEAPVDVTLHDRGKVQAAESFGEVHPRQAPVVLRAAKHGLFGALGVVRMQQIVDHGVDAGEIVVGHGVSVTSSACTACRRSAGDA